VRAILVFDGKVLLGKRGRGDGQGLYALLGGKPDEGETPEQAVVREVKEESGLDFVNPVLFTDETNDKTKPGEFGAVFCKR
jgi:ADP-ribose pyrophosphatase YjhB (NUDIX family)